MPHRTAYLSSSLVALASRLGTSLVTACLLSLGLAGCPAAPPEGDSQNASVSSQASAVLPEAAGASGGAKESVKASGSEVGVQTRSPKAMPKRSTRKVNWGTGIAWKSAEDVLGASKKSEKPKLVMIYADWCSKCRAWGEAFAAPEIVELAQQFDMVRLNQDDNSKELAPFRAQGAYVPRFVFMTASGEINEALTSAHPRYPYFYSAKRPTALVARMREALGL